MDFSRRRSLQWLASLIGMRTLGDILSGKSGIPSIENIGYQSAIEALDKFTGKKTQKPSRFATPSDFGRYSMGSNWRDGRHFDLMDRYLLDLEARRIKKLLILLPVQHGKSTHVVSNFLPWYLSRNPTHEAMLGSYNQTYAESKSQMCLQRIKDHGDVLNLRLATSSPAVSDWTLATGGGLRAVGMDSGITGHPAKLFIIDDPLKGGKQAFSPAQLRAVVDTYLSCIKTRLHPDAVELCIMTPWSPNDTANFFIEQESGWTVIVLPALAEENHPLIDGPDPLGRAPGEPLWPEVGRDEEFLREKRGDNPQSIFWFNTTFQLRPQKSRPEHSGFIKYTQLEQAAELQYHLMPCLTCGTTGLCEHPRALNKAFATIPIDIGLDVARSPEGDRLVWATARSGPDPTSFQKLLHIIVKKGQPTTQTVNDTVALIKELYEKGLRVRSVRIDDGSMGGGVTDGLQERRGDLSAELFLKDVEIIPVGFGNAAFDKEYMANVRTELWWHVGQQLERGRLDLPNRQDLFEDLTGPAMMRSQNGRLLLESKEAMARRGIRSPDIGDAVCLALYPEGWLGLRMSSY